MDRTSLIFCAASLAATVAVSALAFPFAAMSPEDLARSKTPAAAETLPDVDLGPHFGPVSVIDLLGYYIENPPAPPAAGGAPERMRHFGGC